MGPSADLRVLGVGGGGCNAVRRLVEDQFASAKLVAINTDAQALGNCPALARLRLGPKTTRGLGAGASPKVGLAAARESTPELEVLLRGADLVFVAVGLGGGTGTGAAPWIAHLARAQGALVVGVATTPFAFEGRRRNNAAQEGLSALEAEVDCLLLVENDRLAATEDLAIATAFARADAILGDAVRGISELVTCTGLVNLDFADVRAALTGGGRALMGRGKGTGESRAIDAVHDAMRSPLLAQSSIEGARGVLLQFTIDPRLGLSRIHEAASRVHAIVDDEAEILFGVSVDPRLESEVRVTLVAAGLSEAAPAPEPIAEPVLARGRRRNALVMLG